MKKFAAILLSFAMALSLVACAGENEVSPTPDEPSAPTAVSEEPSPSAETPTEQPSEEPSVEPSEEPSPDAPGYAVESKAITGNNMEISYPEFSGEDYADTLPDVNEFFLSRAKQAAEGFAEEVELAGEEGEIYSIEQGYTVEYAHGDVASLLFETSTYYGGVHPNAIQTAYTVDVGSGTLVSIYDVFGGDSNAVREAILAEVISQLSEREDMYDDAADAARELFDPEHFYLTDDGLVVFYETYELGPYFVGPQFFTIPYGSIPGDTADWLFINE